MDIEMERGAEYADRLRLTEALESAAEYGSARTTLGD